MMLDGRLSSKAELFRCGFVLCMNDSRWVEFHMLGNRRPKQAITGQDNRFGLRVYDRAEGMSVIARYMFDIREVQQVSS